MNEYELVSERVARGGCERMLVYVRVIKYICTGKAVVDVVILKCVSV